MLLCDANQASRGWLYLLSDAGLVLAASRGEPPDGLGPYAQAQLDVELDDGSLTMTEAGLTGTPSGGAIATGSETSTEEPGLPTIPLGVSVDGVHHLVGIAILTAEADDTFRSSQTRELASGLAKYLIDSGAYRPVHAA
ncbi:MAG: hypothetical protein OXU20_25645 [Myxococcales bacterium]|nr:hypothetical protein [Myxococcales bacterium]